MTGDTVLFEQRGGVARITLNRPDRLNAFTAEMHADLHAALDRVAQGAGRAVLLTGAGRGFCSGQDLGERDPASAAEWDLGESLDTLYNPLIRQIRGLEVPVVCAVNGPAAGAGASLALACDVVLAARTASFLLAFARIGLVPDSGATWLLPRLVGEARAKGMALLARPIDAETAERWGLVWEVVDDDALADRALGLAAALADGPTSGLGRIKRAIHAGWDNDLDAQLDLERDLQRAAGRTADYREGVAAFQEKRKPTFRGA